jgi:excisionase family DNA binding protein
VATEPVYLTAADVGQLLQVHERTVLRWAGEDATMPATRLPGRTVRFERGALMRWLARKQPRRSTVSAPAAHTEASDA